MTDYNSHVETQYVFFTLYLYNNLSFITISERYNCIFEEFQCPLIVYSPFCLFVCFLKM